MFPYKLVDGEFRLLSLAELSKKTGLYRYMIANKAKLDARRFYGKSATQLRGSWWALMHLDSYSAFADPHILTPSLSNRSKFALGDGRLIPTGTAGVTLIELSEGQDPDPLLAILNSRLLSAYILAHSSPYQGGYFKFSAPYLHGAPIMVADGLVGVKTYARLKELWARRMATANPDARKRVDHRIDEVVNAMYGVTEPELAKAESFIRPLADFQESD